MERMEWKPVRMEHQGDEFRTASAACSSAASVASAVVSPFALSPDGDASGGHSRLRAKDVS
jgi:hypothetical protein